MMWKKRQIDLKQKKNYNTYQFCVLEWVRFVIRTMTKGIVISYLFYDSFVGLLIIIPFCFMDYSNTKKEYILKQKERITEQFRSMAQALVTSLNAGYSLERGFQDAKRDLILLYEKEEDIFAELNLIIDGVRLNRPVEGLIKDFGMRSGVQDIRDFANVIAAAKRSGGNMIHIIEKTVKSISEKNAVEEEIRTMIAEKRLEEKIMMIMPYGIIFYLRVTNGEFMKVLYHNVLGIILMTFFLLTLYLADCWARKVMDIQV